MNTHKGVRKSPALREALEDLFGLTLTRRALTKLIGDDAVILAEYLRRSQESGKSGARRGDVEELADLLWEKAGQLAIQKSGKSAHPMAIRLMQIADTLSVDA